LGASDEYDEYECSSTELFRHRRLLLTRLLLLQLLLLLPLLLLALLLLPCRGPLLLLLQVTRFLLTFGWWCVRQPR
jgi:hypothetical protein